MRAVSAGPGSARPEPGDLDALAFDVAGQGDGLAEQARGLAAAAGKLAGEHGLGLGDAGADHDWLA
jgi:hypothetical protein